MPNIKKTIVIFNGPPKSGKDICAKYFTAKFNRISKTLASHKEVKYQLKQIALLVSGVSEEAWDARYNDRVLKETPWDLCGGLSQRDFFIKISEEWIKPLMGRDYFGRISAQHINDSNHRYYFFSDGGFPEETTPLFDVCDRLLIIRIHREGCTYTSDSRNYIYINDPRAEEYDLYNNGTEQDLFDAITDIIAP